MKLFEGKDSIAAAQAHADAGGQALHVWDPGPNAAYSWPTAPKVFKENRPWAHLFDNNLRRLTETARELGVRSVVVDRLGRKGQHVDLCGRPLDRAIAKCRGIEQLGLF